MCTCFFAFQHHPALPFVLAFNRDEFFERSTAPLHTWEDKPTIIAGRDRKGGGTWMGVTQTGRIGFLTNYRGLFDAHSATAPSRGIVLTDYLDSDAGPEEYAQAILQQRKQFNPFNFVIGTLTELFYLSTVSGPVQRINPGCYGLSNAFLNTPWPKVSNGLTEFRTMMGHATPPTHDALFSLMQSTARPPDNALPNTGVGLKRERFLSALKIPARDVSLPKISGAGPLTYGTRTTTILTVTQTNHAAISEWTHSQNNSESSRITNDFQILKP
jgi:uncharacterized protein with NRDE domain